MLFLCFFENYRSTLNISRSPDSADRGMFFVSYPFSPYDPLAFPAPLNILCRTHSILPQQDSLP